MYCVEWKTRKASPARKSLDESKPATGRSRKPVHAADMGQNMKDSECLIYNITGYTGE